MRCFQSILLIITFFSLYDAQGQYLQENNGKPHLNNWRTMFGYSFFGGNDVSGITMVSEYTRHLNPHFKLGPNFKLSGVKNILTYKSGPNGREDDFLATNAIIFEAGAMGYYEYINPTNIGLEVGLGAFYRLLQYTITTGPFTSGNVGGGLILNESSVGQYVENTVGFNVVLGFVFGVSKTVFINVNGLVQSDTGGNTGYGAFAGLSVKF